MASLLAVDSYINTDGDNNLWNKKAVSWTLLLLFFLFLIIVTVPSVMACWRLHAATLLLPG